ncbi:Aldo/keto reductase [Crepidotus variabilis]|uniref:Aldo/keto reductase n=1 Tax=Crepidotus variabilis TaxID=179855 RepID=A0A9P6EQZ7_9AGAR|nr:Aldo/keto reductase [Crepidotus variabilis]
MPFSKFKLNDGNEIPSIAFGSGSVNKGHDIHEYVEQAIEAGFSHLDTAQFYENEDSVGQAIRESGLDRNELYVTTKWSLGKVDDAIRSSLSALGLTYVDLYLVHGTWLLPDDNDMHLFWRNIERIKKAGLAKSIGVSNFNFEQLQSLVKIAHIKPAVHQIRLNPYNYQEMKPLLEYHAKHGIITEAYSSLAPITRYPGGPVDPVLEMIASKRKIATSQVIFLWVKAKGAVVVTTSSKKERLREYIAVGDLDDLTEEEVRSIDVAASKFEPPSGLDGKRMVVNKKLVLLLLLFSVLVSAFIFIF